MLRLAPDLAKLKKLNQINIQQREAEMDQAQSTNDNALSPGTMTIGQSNYFDQDASSTCIEMFGSMQCPHGL